MGDNEFTCAQCDGTFEKAWSDEEAGIEAAVELGCIPEDERVYVCDPCYQAIMDWGDLTGALDQERARLAELLEESD